MVDYQVDMEMLKNICPVYNDYIQDETANNANNTYNFTQLEGEIMLLKDKYFAKVEYGNQYIDKLNAVEKDYFEKKYGPEIYRYLKDKRDQFIESKSKEECQSMLLSDGSDFDVDEIGNFIQNLQRDISNEFKLYNELESQSNENIANIDNINDNTTTIKDELSKLYSKSSLDKRKIEYRQEEIQKINYYNNMITIFYFFVLFMYFLYLVVTEKLNIGKSWFIYIILIIFPIYIYPFLFYYIKKLFTFLSINMELSGPKHVFINEDVKFNFLG